METINQKAKEGFSQKFIDPLHKYSSTNYLPAIMLAVGNTMVNKTRCRLTLMEHLSSGGDQIYFCRDEEGKAHKSIKQRNLTLLKKSKGFSEVVLKLRHQRSEVKGSRKRTFWNEKKAYIKFLWQENNTGSCRIWRKIQVLGAQKTRGKSWG